MMLFSTGLGWSVLGSLGRNPSCCWAGLQALDRRAGDRTAAGLVYRLWMWHSSAKNKKEGGSAGASPVAAPMPKSVPR